MDNYQDQLEELLEFTLKEQASDLHLSFNHSPIIRIADKLVPLLKKKKFSSVDMTELTKSLMSAEQYQRFLDEKEIDLSYNFQDKARFRINIFFQRGEISIALRLIPRQIKTIEELNLPPELHRFARANQGFVLITGPSSQGKSTTLAALIDEINHTRGDHIITIEDPIEYLFEDDRSIIDQR